MFPKEKYPTLSQVNIALIGRTYVINLWRYLVLHIAVFRLSYNVPFHSLIHFSGFLKNHIIMKNIIKQLINQGDYCANGNL